MNRPAQAPAQTTIHFAIPFPSKQRWNSLPEALRFGGLMLGLQKKMEIVVLTFVLTLGFLSPESSKTPYFPGW
jgi:hypothetical protein